jgi:hypothetical protein
MQYVATAGLAGVLATATMPGSCVAYEWVAARAHGATP